MDYLFTDNFYEDKLWRGIACRACGSPPLSPCVSRSGRKVPTHRVRQDDLIAGRPCDCVACHSCLKNT